MPNYLTELSPDNNTHVYQIKDKEAAPITLLKDTVGWSGKNLLPIEVSSRTIQSVVFTVNSDGSINANGTASPESVIWDICTNLSLKKGTYILSGCPSGASASTYELFINNGGTTYRDYGDGVEFTLNSDTVLDNVRIIVRQGATISNQTFKPMLRDASILDATYEPYHESVEQCKFDRAEQAVLGAKNWLDPYAMFAGQEYVTISESGKTIRVANSTAGSYKMGQWKFPVNPNTVYRVTGSATVTSGICNVSVYDSGNTSEIASSGVSSTSKDIDFTFNSGNNTQICLKLLCTGSSAVGDVTYNDVMLRLASDSDDTYVPYAMTNRELTEKVFDKRIVSSADNINDVTETGIYTVTSQPTNCPFSYGSLIVEHIGASTIRQIGYKINKSSAGAMYVRVYSDGWGNWYYTPISNAVS